MTKSEKVMTPSLRFSGFDDAWKVQPLSELADFRNGKAHEQAISENGDYVVVNSKFISTEGKVRKFSDSQIAPIAAGEITMVMSDIPKGRALAKCYFVEEDDTYTLNQRICALSATNAHGKFLFFRINRNSYFLEFDSGVGQTNLRKDEVLDCPLCCPETLPEQRKIADFLTAVDRRIGQLIQKKALLEDYKKGVMQQLFTQAVRFKDDHGNDFPDWEEKKLEEVVEIKSGLSLDQNGDAAGFKVTRIETISNRTVNLDKIGYVETDKNIEDFRLLPGDILFSNINSVSHIGKVAFVDRDYDLYQGMNLLRLRPGHNSDPRFTFQLLSSVPFVRYFQRICNQAVSQASINQTDLKKTPLNVPARDEQIKIADFLSAIDRKIENVATQITETQTFKRGLLQQMFV